MSAKPLGKKTLDNDQVKQDRKRCRRYDQCGIGEKAVYLPSRLMPRGRYLPYESLERVFRRVAVSPLSGKAFLTPVLYVVFQYEGGQEKQVHFRYLTEADKLFADLEKSRPSLPLLSLEKERQQAKRREEERQLREKELDKDRRGQIRCLEAAIGQLEQRPKLFRELAASAAFKRRMDNIRRGYQILALSILGIGAALTVTGLILMGRGYPMRSYSWFLLLGIAAVFLMANSGILPAPTRNRAFAGKRYEEALAAMALSLRRLPDFPLPPRYAHPDVCRQMIRLIRLERAKGVQDALEELKRDLKAADHTVSLGGEQYRQVTAIKPLFLVQDYR